MCTCDKFLTQDEFFVIFQDIWQSLLDRVSSLTMYLYAIAGFIIDSTVSHSHPSWFTKIAIALCINSDSCLPCLSRSAEITSNANFYRDIWIQCLEERSDSSWWYVCVHSIHQQITTKVASCSWLTMSMLTLLVNYIYRQNGMRIVYERWYWPGYGNHSRGTRPPHPNWYHLKCTMCIPICIYYMM